MKYVLLLVTVASILTGCGASTKIVKSWRDPASTIKEGSQDKTMVMAMVKDAVTRRMVEDNLVKRLGANAVAVPSGNARVRVFMQSDGPLRRQ